MQNVNEYQLETKRRAVQAMMVSRHRDPVYMAKQRQMYDAILAMMYTSLDGLDILSRECHAVGGFTIQEANQWLELFEQIAPIIAQIPFGYGPVKALPVLVTKLASHAGVNIPKVTKAVNTAVDLSGSTSVVTTPLAWADKISQAFSVTGYAHGAATYGAHYATPLGVKAALAPTLPNLLNQIANWTHVGAGAFSQFIAIFSAVGPACAHLMAALKIALSYQKFDGIQSVLDHHPDCHCDCHACTTKIVDRYMDAGADVLRALNPVTAAMPVYRMGQKKVHAVANMFRDKQDRTHLEPYNIALGLLTGAQQPSRNAGCASSAGDGSGRCPLAMLTIATLFGDGDPGRGYKAAVAAIQANAATAADKLKGKIG